VTEYSHVTGAGGSPACVTVKVRSPTMIVLLRADRSLFLSIAYDTVPFPTPGLPAVTLSHAAPLVADHGQLAGALTAKLPVALSLLKDALVGEISMVQGTTPSSRTATNWPAMVSVPVRSAVAALGVTLTLTTPPPLPLEPLVMDIQPLSDAAVHVHWLAVFTVTEFDPPDAGNDNDDVDKV
jgi:hypothetical protein